MLLPFLQKDGTVFYKLPSKGGLIPNVISVWCSPSNERATFVRVDGTGSRKPPSAAVLYQREDCEKSGRGGRISFDGKLFSL